MRIEITYRALLLLLLAVLAVVESLRLMEDRRNARRITHVHVDGGHLSVSGAVDAEIVNKSAIGVSVKNTVEIEQPVRVETSALSPLSVRPAP